MTQKDMTAHARELSLAVTVHRTAGLEVLRAAGGRGEVAIDGPWALANIRGSFDWSLRRA
ncbi:hypothetical protein [Actinocorallia aurea]